jgi:type II secretory pathway pseudopilin PulG
MVFSFTTRRRKREQGYAMMTLLLIFALMAIFAAIIVPEITFSIKRDREEEMIHRGVQYSRAIRAYYKKFGRYPAKIEDLENTNELRFLRKRYKDPLNNKDFRLLHFGEAKLSLNGGMIPGANPMGSVGGLTGAPGFAQSSSFGNTATAANAHPTLGQGALNTSGFGQTPGFNPAAGDVNQAGGDTGQNSATNASSGLSGGGSEQVFGGMPIVGVASFSKNPTIRIFDKKKKYNEWQFVYDPTMDRGLLITTPYQQQIGFGITGTPNLNNQINGPNAGSGGIGTSPGMQNTNPPASEPGNPNQPSDTPVQQ